MWCKFCAISTTLMWVALVGTSAERISKYGWSWLWQPFVQ